MLGYEPNNKSASVPPKIGSLRNSECLPPTRVQDAHARIPNTTCVDMTDKDDVGYRLGEPELKSVMNDHGFSCSWNVNDCLVSLTSIT